MASEVKARTVSVEDFPLLLFVWLSGALDPCLWTTPRAFWSRLQPGCTKQLIKVEAATPLRGRAAAGAVRGSRSVERAC